MARLTPLHPLFEQHRVSAGDDWPVLDALFDWVETNPGDHEIDLSDRVWQIAQTLHIRADNCTISSFRIHGTTAMDRLVLLDATNATLGKVHLRGTGSVNITTRTVLDALVLGSVEGTVIRKVEARNFGRWAVESIGDASNSAIDCTIGNLYAVDCGSPGVGANVNSTAVLRLTYDGIARNSTAGNASQTATLSIDSGVLSLLYPDDLIWVEGSPHLVESVDTDASELTIYGWPSHALTSGDIESGHGGCLSSKGGNTAALRALSIYGRRVGGLVRSGLYMGSDVMMTAELASYCVQIGLTTAGIMLGGDCSIHAEAAVGAIVVKVTRAACRYEVNMGAGSNLARCYGLTIHNASGEPTNDRWNTLEGVLLKMDGVSFSASDQIDIAYGLAPIRASDRKIIDISNKPGENRGSFAFSNTSNDVVLEIHFDEGAARVACKSTIVLEIEGIDDYTTRSPGTVTLSLLAADVTDGWTFGDPANNNTTRALAPGQPARITLKAHPDYPTVKTWLVKQELLSVVA